MSRNLVAASHGRSMFHALRAATVVAAVAAAALGGGVETLATPFQTNLHNSTS